MINPIPTVKAFLEYFAESRFHIIWSVLYDDSPPPNRRPFLYEEKHIPWYSDRDTSDLILAVDMDEMPGEWYTVEVKGIRLSEGLGPWWICARHNAEGPVVLNFPMLDKVHFLSEVDAVSFGLALADFDYNCWGGDRA